MEGLFVKSFLTVSAGPRAWPTSFDKSHSVEENMHLSPTKVSSRHVKKNGGENEESGVKSPSVSTIVQETNEVDLTKDADKKKKWTLGGFFRRKKKEIESDSSSADEESIPRKGFLSRRRSRREKRKSRNNKAVGTFDHVVINPLTQPKYMDKNESSINTSVGKEFKTNIIPLSRSPVSRNKDSRDSLNESIDRLSSRSSHDSLTQRHVRRDSSLTRNSSGGSGSLEGNSLRGRRAIKARVEALRDRQRGDSSSDEGNCFVNSHALDVPRIKSDDSIVILHREGSFNKKSRAARTERYIKRMSRDEDFVLRKDSDADSLKRQRLCKSDAEGSFGRTRSTKRWAVAAYQDSSDYDLRKISRKSSASPSPAQSPLVKPRNALHHTPSAPSASTYNASNIIYPSFPMTGSLDRKVPLHSSSLRVPVSSPTVLSNVSPTVSSKSNESVNVRSAVTCLRSPEMKSSVESNINTENHNPISNSQISGQRSLSYESNIHRAPTLTANPSYTMENNDVMVVQFPVARLSAFHAKKLEPVAGSKNVNISPSCFVAIKQAPPPPPPRDPQRKIFQTSSLVTTERPMSLAFENKQSTNLALSIHEQGKCVSDVYDNSDLFVKQSQTNNKEFQPLHVTNEISVDSPHRKTLDNSVTPAQTSHCTHGFLQQPYTVRSSVIPDTANPFNNHQMLQNDQQCGQKRFISRSESQNYIKPQISTSTLQYFADQNPRSRRPILAQYSNFPPRDQPYLSDSQVVMKPPCQERRNPSVMNATEFWRQKEQENIFRQRKLVTSPKPPLQPARGDRSRSNSPRPKDSPEIIRSKTSKIRPPISFPVRLAESQSSISGQSDVSGSSVTPNSRFHSDLSSCESHESSSSVPNTDSLQRKDCNIINRPLSMVLEKSESQEKPQSETHELNRTINTYENTQSKKEPPVPPTRRYSRHGSESSVEAIEWLPEDEDCDDEKRKRHSSNLEEALTELEAIYNSLRLGDEDLLERAERRDLPTLHQKRGDSSDNLFQNSHFRGSLRGAESDSGFNYGWNSSSFESLYGNESYVKRQRAPPLRRSGIPDKVADDMAYRRLHPKERPGSQDVRHVVSQAGSYLLVSPALMHNSSSESSLPGPEQKSLYAPLNSEPDITFDDVVYRNIRHANNSLKVLDPQPPFGIPLGPITSAANSDYLHAQPENNYKPTFKPRKNPDVVKDDLAYRNLRKDHQKEPVLFPIDDFSNNLNTGMNKKNDSNFSMRRKRAVRSLSANLQSVLSKEPLTLPINSNDHGFEKAQSFSDLPDALQIAQKILEGKDVIGGGAVKLRNLATRKNDSTDSSQVGCVNSRRATSWVERTTLGDRNSLLGGTNTSTETLTDSRANLVQENSNKRHSWQQKLRVSIPQPVSASESGTTTPTQRPPPPLTPERKIFHNPADFAKYSRSTTPSTAPSPISKTPPVSDLLPLPQPVPGSPLDENQLEDLLSALAREAKLTSEKLGQELKELAEETTNLPLLKTSSTFEDLVNTNQDSKEDPDSCSTCKKDVKNPTSEICASQSSCVENNTEKDACVAEGVTSNSVIGNESGKKTPPVDCGGKYDAENSDCDKHMEEQLLIQHTQHQLQNALKQIEERQQQLQTLSTIKTPVDEVVRAIKDKILLEGTVLNNSELSKSTDIETESNLNSNNLNSVKNGIIKKDDSEKKNVTTEDEVTKEADEEDTSVSQPVRCDEGELYHGKCWFVEESSALLVACSYCLACVPKFTKLHFISLLSILFVVISVFVLLKI